MSEQLKRYQPSILRDEGHNYAEMLYEPDGDYVLYADAQARITELEEDARKPWRYSLDTKPLNPPATNPGDYPTIVDTYELKVGDVGHSDRILLLRSNDLDETIAKANARIDELEAKLKVKDELYLAAIKEREAAKHHIFMAGNHRHNERYTQARAAHDALRAKHGVEENS